MEKTIKITKVEVLKEGKNQKTGNPWIRRKIYCSGDDEMDYFISFDDKYVNSEGQQMRGLFAYSEKFKNWQEINQKQELENTKHEELLNALREIYSIVSDIKENLDK